MMAAAGVGSSKINLVLQSTRRSGAFQSRGHTRTCSTGLAQRAKNCCWTQFMRRDDPQLAGDLRLRESRITGCFFEFRGALLAYKAMDVRRTVFIACTHIKNRYGMRLSIISCVRWRQYRGRCIPVISLHCLAESCHR